MEESMAIIPFVRLSGATVEREREGVYVKYSSDPKQWEFLNQQALYMAECGKPFVEVIGIAHGRYWMKEYGIRARGDHAQTIIDAKRSLQQLWSGKRRYIDNNWTNAHRNRLQELCEMNSVGVQITSRLADLFERNVVENSHKLTVCAAIHGDATISNALYDSDGSVRWIDPIPPSLWLPAFKAVDLGKLMQSSHGWEFSMNNWDLPERCDDAVFSDENVVDMMAAHYFHVLCYLRILRYAKEGDHAHNYAMNKLDELLLNS